MIASAKRPRSPLEFQRMGASGAAFLDLLMELRRIPNRN
jgi:hypothetical protein